MATESVIQIIGRDKYGRTLPEGYGALAYTAKHKRRIFYLWIEIVEQSHSLSGSTSQSHFFQHFYSKGYAPQPVSITGRVRDQEMYDDLAQYIRDHQIAMVTTLGSNNPDPAAASFQLPLMTLSVPSEGLVWTGWIERFEGGAKRFNVAPQFTFAFNAIEDRHSTNDKLVPSHALRSAFTGDFLTGPVQQKQDLGQTSGAAALNAQARTNNTQTQDTAPVPRSANQPPD